MPERFGAAVSRALSKTVRVAGAEQSTVSRLVDNRRPVQPTVSDSDKSTRAAKRRSLKPGSTT